MGMSADAILAYGVNLGGDYEMLPWRSQEAGDEHGDLKEWVCMQAGLGWSAAPEGDKKEFYEKRRLARAAFPVDEVYHGYGDDAMILVAVPGSVSYCYYGDTKVVRMPEIWRLPHFLPFMEKLKEWGLDPYQSDWHLMSYLSY